MTQHLQGRRAEKYFARACFLPLYASLLLLSVLTVMDGYRFWLHPTEKSVTSRQGEVTPNPSAWRQQSLADCFQGHWGLDSSLPPTSPVSLLPSFTQVLVNHHLNKCIWPLLHMQILTTFNLCVIVLLKNKTKQTPHEFSHK